VCYTGLQTGKLRTLAIVEPAGTGEKMVERPRIGRHHPGFSTGGESIILCQRSHVLVHNLSSKHPTEQFEANLVSVVATATVVGSEDSVDGSDGVIEAVFSAVGIAFLVGAAGSGGARVLLVVAGVAESFGFVGFGCSAAGLALVVAFGPCFHSSVSLVGCCPTWIGWAATYYTADSGKMQVKKRRGG